MKMNEKQIIVKTMRLLLEASEVAKTNAKKYDEDSFQRGFLIGKYNAYNNVFNLLERELKYNNDEQSVCGYDADEITEEIKNMEAK